MSLSHAVYVFLEPHYRSAPCFSSALLITRQRKYREVTHFPEVLGTEKSCDENPAIHRGMRSRVCLSLSLSLCDTFPISGPANFFYPFRARVTTALISPFTSLERLAGGRFLRGDGSGGAVRRIGQKSSSGGAETATVSLGPR